MTWTRFSANSAVDYCEYELFGDGTIPSYLSHSSRQLGHSIARGRVLFLSSSLGHQCLVLRTRCLQQNKKPLRRTLGWDATAVSPSWHTNFIKEACNDGNRRSKSFKRSLGCEALKLGSEIQGIANKKKLCSALTFEIVLRRLCYGTFFGKKVHFEKNYNVLLSWS